ncbi:MAG: hypothetical protein JRH13_10600 [Deltaproteobacteria bacterium]|nr:hypothetical protein [Deltaproteobacteria bacterium]MBW2016360.1 hypothetical protein [Deltaproteobacteria bacterium]MBW2129800.1 hypothetical protein [Deltaproteobacteria bacterium]MBW2304553.1 hypothetical protein [Deltaproteobacteria bacterium]
MDKIVSLEQRIHDKRRKEERERYLKRIRSLQRSVQCTACHLRCAMCGVYTQIRNEAEKRFFLSNGFALCENCKKEYEDFKALSGKETPSDVHWHNKEWFRMWSAWIEYRKALRAFLESPEFKRLLEELNQ